MGAVVWSFFSSCPHRRRSVDSERIRADNGRPLERVSSDREQWGSSAAVVTGEEREKVNSGPEGGDRESNTKEWIKKKRAWLEKGNIAK